MKQQNNILRTTCFTAAMIAFLISAPFQSFGQDDAVYRKREGGGNSRVGGKVTGMTPFGVTVDTAAGPKEVLASQINKIAFADEPLEIGRARDRMESGRYDDALEALGKITDKVSSPMVKQEIDFLKAYSTSMIALRAGNISPTEAGKLVAGFIREHPKSVHLFPAVELFGKLSFAVGRPEFAEKEFAKLAQSKWPELVMRGHVYRGQALNELGKHPEAQAEFEKVVGMEGNDDLTQAYRLLATCEKAKTMALSGDHAAALPMIDEIIKVENPDNARLFATAYNAKGTCYLKAGNLKEAALAFLHTELLFASEAEPHAEALYNLALLWPQLDQTDRASRAREGLKSRYRNSYWASKL